ncbi:SMP-30/gluconolactonase/LRE family protein [Aldersonia sp. NBC_00410]|uniref:SMP-30/gluconolactonase/LRE family protein n=1 Tax=Aldersonia sp. NBC_00410 TaxID=2975954 RepID=UPI002259862E|nr:hypothetical protein [Aldersonia sp. NBC_00410]MCX5041747.1 SMP-30/gluconolactonase/LRE family protein [Aldersonia sp. NBC_00410]
MTSSYRTAVAAALLIGTSVIGGGVGQAEPAPDTCRPWTATTISSGHGMLENLAFDGRGAMLLSRLAFGSPGSIDRLDPAGNYATVVASVESPGGITVAGNTVYFATGNSPVSLLTGAKDGTVDTYDLDSGMRQTYARGLTMPNGLTTLPDGDLVVSGNQRLTVVHRSDPARPEPYALAGVSTNGLAVDPTGRWLYTDSTFDPTTKVFGVDIAAPGAPAREWPVPGFGLLNIGDDLTTDAAGNVYIALNLAGKVIRLNPATGAQCTIAQGLTLTSSVRLGAGPGWDPNSLYATGWDGSVRKLTP